MVLRQKGNLKNIGVKSFINDLNHYLPILLKSKLAMAQTAMSAANHMTNEMKPVKYNAVKMIISIIEIAPINRFL